MTLSVPLAVSASANAGNDGIARITIGPLRSFETWHVRSTAVASTSNVKVPTVRTYRGAETPSRLIEGTYTGTLNASDTAYDLRSGERLVVVFAGGDVGSQCTVTLEGESER